MNCDTMETSGTPESFNSVGFIVNDRPVALYGAGLRRGSNDFIKYFDADYWDHQVSLATSIPKENVPHEHVASVRLALSHAEEHLFALIFAFLQAPHCPDLWLYHYKPSDLPQLVEKVGKGERVLTQFALKETSWEAITKSLWPWIAQEQYDATNRLLRVLADHFICFHRRDEYNGLKHGMRLSFGGTSISFSPGGSPDTKPPPESFISIADSKYGSRFWSFDKIPGAKNHWIAKLRFSNWDYMELGYYLTQVAMLIGNIGSAFRACANIEGDRSFLYLKRDAAHSGELFEDDMIGGNTSDYQIPESMLVDLEEVRKLYS